MIRLITERDDDGDPVAWADYENRQLAEVTPLLGMKFDRELVELDALGVDLGVRLFTEALWLLEKFGDDTMGELRRVMAGVDENDADAVQAAQDEAERWMARDPRFTLAERVGLWAALNLGGRPITLREVYEIPPRDVIELPDLPRSLAKSPQDHKPSGKGTAGSRRGSAPAKRPAR